MIERFHATVDLTPLKKHVEAISRGSSTPIQRCHRRWGKRYEAFIRRDFTRQSSGGGRWPALDPATVARRRKEGVGAKILRDTGTLLAALTIGAPGNVFKLEKDGCLFGFGGPARHPGGKARIADIARFHDSGAGTLPQRQIIVPPDAATIAGMESDVKWAIDQLK